MEKSNAEIMEMLLYAFGLQVGPSCPCWWNTSCFPSIFLFLKPKFIFWYYGLLFEYVVWSRLHFRLIPRSNRSRDVNRCPRGLKIYMYPIYTHVDNICHGPQFLDILLFHKYFLKKCILVKKYIKIMLNFLLIFWQQNY